MPPGLWASGLCWWCRIADFLEVHESCGDDSGYGGYMPFKYWCVLVLLYCSFVTNNLLGQSRLL